ncbi:hypothetical protein RhiirA4_470261 [Rhizophagus irregularis]|uniref:Uncharacterized protein n=1 Tax=Rhizophagus irregularis TaxID=588596 RepID=A0A2I1H115_9GLOM|nr:hypothetical protein RhiirA4_470261 [Rhizophagus irregularis]
MQQKSNGNTLARTAKEEKLRKKLKSNMQNDWNISTKKVYNEETIITIDLSLSKAFEKFHKKMNKLQYVVYPVCKESYPSIAFINRKYWSRQYGYKGNVINFSQDIQEFAILTTSKASIVIKVLILKANNWYYTEIIINEKALQSLQKNDSI